MKPKLTICDWEEIYYALRSKIGALCAYGDPKPGTSDDLWVKHLEEIMKQIGDDGHAAARAFGGGECNNTHKWGHHEN